jgi:YggT family protein
VRADFYNPLTQSFVKISNPFLSIFNRVFPVIGSIDTAAIALLFSLKILQTYLLHLISDQPFIFIQSSLISIYLLLQTATYMYIVSFIALVLSSWIVPHSGVYKNPALSVIYSITEPLLSRVRKIIPPVGILDFSVMVAMVALFIFLEILRYGFYSLLVYISN